MGVSVILTPQSQDDLRAIVVYIAKDSPERARSFALRDVTPMATMLQGRFKI